MTERGQFSPEQVDRLLRPIRPNRVFTKQGQSHVAGWDIAAHLTRMFGFGGWQKEILSLDLVAAGRGAEVGAPEGKNGWYVTYRCVMRLTVYDEHGRVAFMSEDAASGTAQNQPILGDAHDFAMKNAVTYALKRCAKDLGDQFGLSLYNKGQRDALVGMTLVHPSPGEEPDVAVQGEDHDPTTTVSGPSGAADGSPAPNTHADASSAAQAKTAANPATSAVSVDDDTDVAARLAELCPTAADKNRALRRAHELAASAGVTRPSSFSKLLANEQLAALVAADLLAEGAAA